MRAVLVIALIVLVALSVYFFPIQSGVAGPARTATPPATQTPLPTYTPQATYTPAPTQVLVVTATPEPCDHWLFLPEFFWSHLNGAIPVPLESQP